MLALSYQICWARYFSLIHFHSVHSTAVLLAVYLLALATGSLLLAPALARRWNPLRAFGPRLLPVVHVADEEARERARTVVERLLPPDKSGRRRAASTFNARATAATRRLGGVYHAERLWLFLPSGDGLPEVQHPLERGVL